jgi:tight adherence protein C
MPLDFAIALIALFVGVAVVTGALAANALGRMAPERRRLDQLAVASTGLVVEVHPLTDAASSPLARRMSQLVPKSPRELSILRRRLTAAGYRGMDAAIFFSTAKIAMPITMSLAVLLWAGMDGILFAVLAAMGGFMVPEAWLSYETRRRQQVIRHGLPDALDLFIVCLEAGSSLDQAIVKASDELGITYPALAEELRLTTLEVRAGKPRLEAFKNFAARTKVDDVRALVAMLVQTDRFGTSVGQALRTHADQSRTRRRQIAEERAAKLSVKLIFPLIFFLFPALYVVILGPAVIKILRFFTTNQP